MNQWFPTLISIPVLVGLASSGEAQTGDPEAGAAYAKQVCAKCHAIDRTGLSPEPTAPPFKDVANTPGMTATALAVGSRHHTRLCPTSFSTRTSWTMSSLSFSV